MDATPWKLRKHWMCLCVTTFGLYVAFLARYVSLYDLEAFSARLEMLMFLLSFPFGTLFMYIFYTGIGGVTERILLWPIALGIGYFQWFHVIPILIARRQSRVTTLNLSAPNKVASGASTEGRLPHFDSDGHTPLEKLLVETSQNHPSVVSFKSEPQRNIDLVDTVK